MKKTEKKIENWPEISIFFDSVPILLFGRNKQVQIKLGGSLFISFCNAIVKHNHPHIWTNNCENEQCDNSDEWHHDSLWTANIWQPNCSKALFEQQQQQKIIEKQTDKRMYCNVWNIDK